MIVRVRATPSYWASHPRLRGSLCLLQKSEAFIKADEGIKTGCFHETYVVPQKVEPVGTFDYSCRCGCPTLPAHGLETAGGQVPPQTDSQPLLISCPPAGLWAPLPRWSALTICKAPSAPQVADGKGTREYKGAPGFQLGASQPAGNQRRALCWNIRGWDSIKGACSPKGSPRRPGFVAGGVEIALQDKGLRPLRPTRTSTDRDGRRAPK